MRTIATRGHVIICFAEALAAPEAVFSLQRAGFRVVALSRRGSRPLLRRLSSVELVEVTAPETNVDECMQECIAAIQKISPVAFLPLDDNSLWIADELRLAVEAHPPECAVVAPSPTGVAVALDKWRQIQLAKKAGFDVPPSILADSAHGLDGWHAYPAIAKARFASVRTGSRLATKAGAYLDGPVKALPDGGPFVIQPLVSGVGEGVFGLAVDGEILASSAHQRLRMVNPHGSGASACKVQDVRPELMEATRSFVGQLRWSGPFMIELLTDSAGRSWFMELNGRLWGSTALARRAGLEYPQWAVEVALNPSFRPDVRPSRAGLSVRHLARDVEHFVAVLKGPRTAFHAKTWPARLPTLKAILTPQAPSRFYNYDQSAPLLFAWELVDHMTKQIFRKKRR